MVPKDASWSSRRGGRAGALCGVTLLALAHPAHADDKKAPAPAVEPRSADDDRAEIARLGRQAELLQKRAALAEAERKARLDTDGAAARDKLDRLRLANDLATAEAAARKRELEVREAELRVKAAELQTQRSELELQLARINVDLDLRDKRDYWRNRVAAEPRYLKEPYAAGVLTISDRRIALNGVITLATAEHFAERVHYFNNQSGELPIFLVIDGSPGGSAMAGWKIFKTMQGSAAPIYVVVKSYAASLAAAIVILGKRSFAYPNAILLHHQMSTGTAGNMTQLREQQKEAEEWWQRFAGPVAARMGISIDEYVKRMYQRRSTGDWREFADAARKLRWVDEVVEVIREESIVKNPDAPPPPVSYPMSPSQPSPRRAEVAPSTGWTGAAAPPSLDEPSAEQVDRGGQRYRVLPHLEPFDAWFLYSPDGYYRAQP